MNKALKIALIVFLTLASLTFLVAFITTLVQVM
jgi:hypothetical protein